MRCNIAYDQIHTNDFRNISTIQSLILYQRAYNLTKKETAVSYFSRKFRKRPYHFVISTSNDYHIMVFKFFESLPFVVVGLLLIIASTNGKEQQDHFPHLPSIPASSLLPLTHDKLRLVSYAMLLSDVVYKDELTVKEKLLSVSNYSKLKYIDTGADAAILLDIDSYCFLSFRGSNPPTNLKRGTIVDWFFQNRDFARYSLNKRQSSSSSTVCTVQRGFYDAYAGIGKRTIQKFIDACMSNNRMFSNDGTDEKSKNIVKKQLVFTGHSQGGAAAIVGAIIDANYVPLTITFGQPPVMLERSCPHLNEDHIWRFINTENSNGGLQYDVVS
jgi:Lipase (class 3)